MDGLDRTAYGLRFSSIDEARGTAEVKTTQAADAIERNSDGKWEPLEEGDLVLLRRFDVEKHCKGKSESLWEQLTGRDSRVRVLCGCVYVSLG